VWSSSRTGFCFAEWRWGASAIHEAISISEGEPVQAFSGNVVVNLMGAFAAGIVACAAEP
jgi:hypothetical protein